MSASRNSTDFEIRLSQIDSRYQRMYTKMIAENRASLTGKLPDEVINQDLEAHKRAYYLDELLDALNWKLSKNLVPEGPVKSEDNGEIKYLDYLGFEATPSAAALIFEAKRTKERLPKLAVDSDISLNMEEVICLGLEGKDLTGDWNDWLKTLKDYYCSVKKRSDKIPKRVVISNGDWLIIFSNPEDSFCANRPRNRAAIHVFKDFTEMLKGSNKIYEILERSNVITAPFAVEMGEIGNSITQEKIICRLNGTIVSKSETPMGSDQWTVSLYVTPVVFLQLDSGQWVWLEDRTNSLPIPVRYEELARHLKSIEDATTRLNDQLTQKLGGPISRKTLKEHYESLEFNEMPGVFKLGAGELRTLIVLGEHSHFIRVQPSVLGCSFHSWLSAKEHDVAISRMIEQRNIYSFFIDTELHHCSHKNAFDFKGTKINAISPQINRSGKSEEAFCELWRLDQTLCCRTCVFEPVCDSEIKFRLPCVA